jgi:hypothetical protein
MSASVVVTFAMFVSAISACACVHHGAETESIPTVSCHSAAHEDAAIEKAEILGGSYVGGECECIVRVAVPVIAAKSENKLAKPGDHLTASDGPCTITGSVRFSQAGPTSFHTNVLYYRDFSFAGPSRAPPRA